MEFFKALLAVSNLGSLKFTLCRIGTRKNSSIVFRATHARIIWSALSVFIISMPVEAQTSVDACASSIVLTQTSMNWECQKNSEILEISEATIGQAVSIFSNSEFGDIWFALKSSCSTNEICFLQIYHVSHSGVSLLIEDQVSNFFESARVEYSHGTRDSGNCPYTYFSTLLIIETFQENVSIEINKNRRIYSDPRCNGGMGSFYGRNESTWSLSDTNLSVTKVEKY